jgi:hypothetical protein
MNLAYQAVVLLLLSALLDSCAPQAKGTAFLPGRPDEALIKQCVRAFPGHDYQFVHAIDFSLAHGRGGSLIGVTDLNGPDLRCALLTIEGMTLFKAEVTDGRLRVLRAVEPFTSIDFARALVADVRAMFLRPPGLQKMQTGMFENSGPGCRVVSPSRTITDILPTPDGCWTLRIHDGNSTGLRTVTARSCSLHDGYLLPRELTLSVPGSSGYRLTMRLLEAEQPLQGTQTTPQTENNTR